jgi:DNA-binding IclR family transcriptional regulator
MGEWRTEVRGVAAPIFDSTGRAVAAIGVCSPDQRMPDSRLAETCDLVTEIAACLSQQLGGAPRTARDVHNGTREDGS